MVSQDALSQAYVDHYLQTGGMNVFRGGQHQYGEGIGALLRSAARFLLPVAARTATKFISSAAQGVGSGNSLKDAALEALLPTLDEAMTSTGSQIRKRRKPVVAKKKPKRKVGKYKKLHNQKGKGRRVYKGKRKQVKSKRSRKVVRILDTNF